MNGIINSNNSPYKSMEAFKSKHSSNRNPGEAPGKVQLNENDPFMKWPLRGLAYSNELGECLRPVIGQWAWAFWAPAIAYIGADVADKYKKGPDGVENPSKKRAAKQLSFQTLASVLLPTGAVKLGNYAVNRVSRLGGSNISLGDKDGLISTIAESMRHETHATDAYKGNRQKYIDHIVTNFKAERDKTTSKIFKGDGIIGKVARFIKKPFVPTSTDENLTKFAKSTVNDALDMYDSLVRGVKPDKISQKQFEKFTAKAKEVGNQKAASRLVEKALRSKTFKTNKAIIAAGGFISLGLLMKPIDKFVENTLIEKYIEPTIYNFDKSQPLKSFTDAVNFQRRKRKEEAEKANA